MDLIELGTRAATAAFDPAAAELVVALLVPVAAGAAELVADDDELLLLPHPTIAAALSNVIATDRRLFLVRIALLRFSNSQPWPGRRIGNIARPKILLNPP